MRSLPPFPLRSPQRAGESDDRSLSRERTRRRRWQKLAKTTYAQLVPADHPDYKALPLAQTPATTTAAHALALPAQPPATALPPSAGASTSTAAAAEAGAASKPDSAPPAASTGKKAQNQHTKRREAEEKARQQLAAEVEAKAKVAKIEKKANKAPDVWKVVKNKLDKTTQMKEKETCAPSLFLAPCRAAREERTDRPALARLAWTAAASSLSSLWT